jgi:MoaA/NifB/PqqE/SkfB family radical SAM enzyme
MPQELKHNTQCDPEIVISYHCNLDICPYCYAREQNIKDIMCVKDFSDFASWFKELFPSLDGITLLGGEPTALTNLEEYVKAAAEHDLRVSLFTNGSFNDSRREIFDKKFIKRVYFHLEPVQFLLVPGHEKMFTENIRNLVEKEVSVSLRVNFHGMQFDYMRPIEIASEMGVPIAWSITSPCNSMGEYIRRKNLKDIGYRLVEFFRESKNQGIDLELVRPIPRCAFEKESFGEFADYTNLGKHCNVSTYVHPNRVVQLCTVMDCLKQGPINNAQELRAAIEYFQQIESVLRNVPSFESCPSCDNYKKKLCQGGCMSYKLYGDHT